MKIKICGLTDQENISEVLTLDPDYIGFIFYPPSPRYMAKRLKPEDIKNLDVSSRKTGVFVNSSYDNILDIYQEYDLQVIQLHGDEDPDFCAGLNRKGLEVIKAFRLNEAFDFQVLKKYQSFCNYFLFDTKTELKGGSGEKFDWGILDKYELEHPFFLSGGISAWDVRGIMKINHKSLAGVDLNSRFEIRPGIKNISLLKQFIEELRER